MATVDSSHLDIQSLCTSLRRQIVNYAPNDDSEDALSLPAAVFQDVQQLLEMLDGIELDAAAAPEDRLQDRWGSPQKPDVTTDLIDSIDCAMSTWQAKISLAYAEGAARELSDHLKLAELLSNSLMEREQRLEQQKQQFEKLAAETLKQQVRMAGQRKTIAQMLRARKANMLLAVMHRHEEIRQEVRREVAAEYHTQQSDQFTTSLNTLEEQLAEARDALRIARQETEELKLANHNNSADALARADALQEQLTAAEDELNQLRKAAQQTDALSTELYETQQLLSELENRETQHADNQQLKDVIAEVEGQLQQAQDEIERLKQQQSEADLLSDSTKVTSSTELEALREEMQDLRQQNSDLAAQIAKHQVISSGHTPHVCFDQQSLCWEERKKIIMQQLESELEESGTTEAQEKKRLDVEQVLSATQLEIERRDREIEELRSIVEQQSDTRQGVAIGAAAFAQMFDTDEMIQEERQRLRDIQQQWEEKLRQAEIDLSMERAKLARERSQLEIELEKNKTEQPTVAEATAAAEANESGQPKKRKWLEHLGLKDENRGKT